MCRSLGSAAIDPELPSCRSLVHSSKCRQIARKIKDTRDEHFIETDDQGRLVNRLEAIAHVGSAALDNEECSMLVKMMRALGLVYIEHQARI